MHTFDFSTGMGNISNLVFLSSLPQGHIVAAEMVHSQFSDLIVVKAAPLSPTKIFRNALKEILQKQLRPIMTIFLEILIFLDVSLISMHFF